MTDIDKFQDYILNASLATIIIELVIITSTLVYIMPTNTYSDMRHLSGLWAVITVPMILVTMILYMIVYFCVPKVIERQRRKVTKSLDFQDVDYYNVNYRDLERL